MHIHTYPYAASLHTCTLITVTILLSVVDVYVVLLLRLDHNEFLVRVTCLYRTFFIHDC